MDTLTRRDWLRAALAGAAALLATGTLPRAAGAAGAAPAGPPPAMKVYKRKDCGCCAKWVDHVRANGFTVTTFDTDEMDDVKASFGVPNDLESCHTGVVRGYVVEGHVPADVITRMLAEKPKGLGIAVPGMPMGSPGMEGARKDKYDVLLFQRGGTRRVYASR